jgi:hypothetical protein
MNRSAIMRGGVWLGILIVAGGVLFGLVQAYRSIPTQSFLLPDGSRFTFLGVTMANEKFSTDKPWHKPLRRWLPARWPGYRRLLLLRQESAVPTRRQSGLR